MDYRDEIISEIAKVECERICRGVIHALQRMTDGMQSGDDTPLKNIWDEVCVQVQLQQSFFWDLYLDTIRLVIRPAVQTLDVSRKQAIWLQTSYGIDWVIENDGPEVPPFCEDDIDDYILNDFVLSKAADWRNKRIEEYLESFSTH